MDSKKAIKRLMNKLGDNAFKELIELREADIKGCNERNKGPFLSVENIKESYREILANKECFSLKDLAINGKDLIALGMKPGKEIGNVLKELLNNVEEEKVPNDKESLINAVKEMKLL
jgi:tRNA nucleotidyltransferase (CCA-adding enzyme)